MSKLRAIEKDADPYTKHSGSGGKGGFDAGKRTSSKWEVPILATSMLLLIEQDGQNEPRVVHASTCAKPVGVFSCEVCHEAQSMMSSPVEVRLLDSSGVAPGPR